MGKYSRLGKNTLLVFIGNAGSKLIGLFMLPFYTRWLSVEDYGTTDVITVYVTFLLGIVTCSIAESIFIFPKGQSKEMQGNYFSSGLCFLLVAVGVAGFLFSVLQKWFATYSIQNSFTENLWLIWGMLSGQSLQQFMQQFTRSIDRMAVYSIAGVVVTAATALLSFWCIPGYGVTGYVVSIILANTLGASYSFIFSRAYTYWSVKHVSMRSCKEMLAYSIPLIPNGVMWWLVGALNRPLMESYLGLHAIGIFAVANKFPGILSMLFAVFGSSWQISVLEEFGKKGYSDFFNKVLRMLSTGLIIMLLAITLCSKLLVLIFATGEFYEAWKYIPLLTLGVVFSCISSMAGSNFSATRESKYFFYSSVWGAVAAIIFNILLIPWMGLWGTALAVTLSFMVMAVSRVAYGWKYVQITHLKRYVMIGILGVIPIVAMNFIESWWLMSFLIFGMMAICLYCNKDLWAMLKMKYIRFRESKNSR